MSLPASDIAAILRDRLPGLGAKKLHKLLYYCQGHHLATFDEPLFSETISAWDMGPVVGQLWHQDREGRSRTVRGTITEAQFNTVGYVLSRYGSLTGHDLQTLTHGESPWRRTDRNRASGATARIELEWIREFFSTDGAAEDDEDAVTFDPSAVTQWLRDAPRRRTEPVRQDSREELRARLSAGA